MYEVIVNPAARNGQARQIGEEAERYLKEKQVDFVIRYTEYPGHATEWRGTPPTAGWKR